VRQDGGVSTHSASGRPDQSTPAWLAAPPAETARAAFFLTAIWCFSEFIWAAPSVFDNNASSTTIPLPNLIVWIGGLLALLTSLASGLLAIARSGRVRIIRAVLYSATLMGGVVVSIALVGVKVSSSTTDPNRRAHAYLVCAVALAVLGLARLFLGIRGKRP
jgi:hypothetical protein